MWQRTTLVDLLNLRIQDEYLIGQNYFVVMEKPTSIEGKPCLSTLLIWYLSSTLSHVILSKEMKLVSHISCKIWSVGAKWCLPLT